MHAAPLHNFYIVFGLPRAVILDLFSTMPPLSNCPLFHTPMTISRLYKQMYLLVNLLIKHFILHSA